MTKQNYDLVSAWVDTSKNAVAAQITAVLSAVCLLSLLAQVAIPLPWTPVPVTGQTLGVAFVSLLWGRRWGFLGVVSYMILGGLGAPVFANAASGLLWGPTFGYLVGMVLASRVMGLLADKNGRRSFARTLFITYTGSVITLSCGLAVLSFFVPAENLLFAGLLPFLPGDLIKNLLVAGILSYQKEDPAGFKCALDWYKKMY